MSRHHPVTQHHVVILVVEDVAVPDVTLQILGDHSVRRRRTGVVVVRRWCRSVGLLAE